MDNYTEKFDISLNSISYLYRIPTSVILFNASTELGFITFCFYYRLLTRSPLGPLRPVLPVSPGLPMSPALPSGPGMPCGPGPPIEPLSKQKITLLAYDYFTFLNINPRNRLVLKTN